MAGAGQLELDERVQTYLPDFSMADKEAQTITLRHLLSQTGGIPERMDLTDRYDADRRPGDVVDDLSDVHLATDVGAEHLCSSVNYMLLAAVVEEVTGRGWAWSLRLTNIGIAAGCAVAAAGSRVHPGSDGRASDPRVLTLGSRT